jgi:hypothetical protein
VQLIDLSGRIFGRLTVIERANNIGHHTAFRCVCSCGRTLVVRAQSLRKGDTGSCGCFRAEKMAAAKTKHGLYGTPTYRSWRAMLARCSDVTHRQFKDYGGRGIRVCDRWVTSFESFSGTTLDREDNDGHYEPGNCRWATHLEQNRNKRTTNQGTQQ